MNNNSLLAAVNFEELANEATPKLAGQGVGGTISIILTLIFPIAGFVLIAMLISAGYQYMVSAGDPKVITKAQSTITYSIVGFVVIFVSYFIAQYFGLALRVNQLIVLFGGGAG